MERKHATRGLPVKVGPLQSRGYIAQLVYPGHPVTRDALADSVLVAWNEEGASSQWIPLAQMEPDIGDPCPECGEKSVSVAIGESCPFPGCGYGRVR